MSTMEVAENSTTTKQYWFCLLHTEVLITIEYVSHLFVLYMKFRSENSTYKSQG